MFLLLSEGIILYRNQIDFMDEENNSVTQLPNRAAKKRENTRCDES
jgi:hypothetical protein